MTTPAVGVTSLHPTRPYLTTDLYREEPTGVPTDNLVPGGSARDSENLLAREILRASAEMNSFVYGGSGGVLHATVDTEAMDVRLDRHGLFNLFPRLTPVLALNSISVGSDPSSMSVVTDLSTAKVQLDRCVVQAYPFTGTSSAGPLQFGRIPGPTGMYWVQYSYVNGWPVTTLTADAAAGSGVTVQVGDTTGIYAGVTQVTIRDPFGMDESFIPTAVTPTTVTGTLAALHRAGCQLDALHPDIYTACVEITTGLLKRRAQEQISGPAKRNAEADDGEANFAEGFDLLTQFLQVRTR